MNKDFECQKHNFLKEKQNFVWKYCESYTFQIVQLKRVIERYEKGKIGLDGLLSQQRYSNYKSRVGYSRSNKSSVNKLYL